MPINPLILDKISRLDVPEKIKTILGEILEMEDRLEMQGEKKNAVLSISKILEKYSEDEDIREFCA